MADDQEILRARAQLEGRRQATESRTPEEECGSWTLVELPEEESSAGPQHAGDFAETREQRLIIQMLEDMRRENDIKRAVAERQACGGRNLQADTILEAGACDLSVADPNQVGRDVNAGRGTNEVDPFRERDQDVPDPAPEVENPILA